MMHFEPITEEEFTEYWNYSVESWTGDMKRAGLISRNISLEEANAQVRKFIPEGMNTPGHYFFHAVEANERIGKVWIEVRKRGDIEAYLWDIFIDERFRGIGYGKQVMNLVENFARGKGAMKVSLNVFSYNDIARNLYLRAGYREAAITMIKDL